MTKTVGGIAEFDEALKIVLSHAADLVGGPSESVNLLGCSGRVLAAAVNAALAHPAPGLSPWTWRRQATRG